MSKTTTTEMMTPAEAQAITNEIKSTLTSIPELIHRAMCGQAHLALGYKSVAEWADTEFGYSRSRAYQLFNWKNSESRFIEKCDLANDWIMLESDLRGFTGHKLESMLQLAKVATADVVDQQKRGQVVRRLILKANADRKAEKEIAKAAKATVMQNTPSVATTPSIAPATTSFTGFSVVPVSLEYAKVKTADTAAMLSMVASVESSEISELLDPLIDAWATLGDLIDSIEKAGESK